jgi:hypothetical protein
MWKWPSAATPKFASFLPTPSGGFLNGIRVDGVRFSEMDGVQALRQELARSGRDIQLMRGIAGRAHPIPATT